LTHRLGRRAVHGGREEKRADALRKRDFTAEDTEEDEEESFQLSVLSFQ
jgi:hypothetical protein